MFLVCAGALKAVRSIGVHIVTELDPSSRSNCILQLLHTPWYALLVTTALASVDEGDGDSGHQSVLALLKSLQDKGATVSAGSIALEGLGVPPIRRGMGLDSLL